MAFSYRLYAPAIALCILPSSASVIYRPILQPTSPPSLNTRYVHHWIARALLPFGVPAKALLRPPYGCSRTGWWSCGQSPQP